MKFGKSVRDTFSILGTRVLWSAMGIVSGVILARWLGPYDRGILALILLVPSTVLTLTKLGVSQATIYYINRKEASVDEVASNSLILALVLGTVSATIVWLLRDNLLSTILASVPTWALALALVRVPLLLLDNYLFSVLQATGRFTVYNTRLLLSEAIRLGLVAIFVMGFDLGLPAAVATYTAVSVLNMSWLVLTMSRTVNFRTGFHAALLNKMLSFGVRSYVQVAMVHLLQRIDVYMVQSFLGPKQTAFYSLAAHFTELVLEIPQAIGLVLFPRLAALPEEEIHRLTAQTCRRTLLVTVPAAAAVGLFGPWVITLWYGQAYAAAGDPLPWSAVGVAMMSIFVIVTRDFTARSKQRVNTAAGAVALVAKVTLNAWLIPANGIVGAAMATAISYTGACMLLITFFVIDSGVPVRRLLLPTREDIEYFLDLLRGAMARFRP
jgi:O-antigen/teichoic acid export membrane protein